MWESKLTEVMDKAAEKIKSLGDERTQLISGSKLLISELKFQQEQNNLSKSNIKKLKKQVLI